ncbi:transcription factor RelB isoform X2 [Lathamus discolor]|uniref:transcription factor RelB isoform X2 n=1 Tax=Lathamus discolor TaxID=678569 RepID=UPI0032B7A346
MKEDGFQPDPAPLHPKAPPRASAKLVPRGSSPMVGTARAGSTPQLTQSLSNLSLGGARSRWIPGAGNVKEELEELLEPPRLVITEQPKQRGMRFRYECEGRSAGSILGQSSTEASKTLPAIELLNCGAIPEVTVTACLVWKDWPHRVHPHGLVGKDCSNGLCQVVLRPQSNPRHSFSNLGIQCVKKKEIEAAIERKLQLGIDPFKAGALRNHQEVDMNVVRICFQASYRDPAGHTRHLGPVLSEPIFDKKSTNTSELRICRMNKESGPCTGGEELYLLCDKVQKGAIPCRGHRGCVPHGHVGGARRLLAGGRAPPGRHRAPDPPVPAAGAGAAGGGGGGAAAPDGQRLQPGLPLHLPAPQPRRLWGAAEAQAGDAGRAGGALRIRSVRDRSQEEEEAPGILRALPPAARGRAAVVHGSGPAGPPSLRPLRSPGAAPPVPAAGPARAAL